MCVLRVQILRFHCVKPPKFSGLAGRGRNVTDQPARQAWAARLRFLGLSGGTAARLRLKFLTLEFLMPSDCNDRERRHGAPRALEPPRLERSPSHSARALRRLGARALCVQQSHHTTAASSARSPSASRSASTAMRTRSTSTSRRAYLPGVPGEWRFWYSLMMSFALSSHLSRLRTCKGRGSRAVWRCEHGAGGHYGVCVHAS